MPPRLVVELDDESVGQAWEKMRGIRLALEVELTANMHHGAGQRNVLARRVLGIEQPIYAPRSRRSEIYQSNSAARMQGYIQGVVLETPTRSEGGPTYSVRLRMGNRAVEASLQCINPYLISTREERTPREGDEIRSRVSRGLPPWTFFETPGNMYVSEE